jgi:hypothetical protein
MDLGSIIPLLIYAMIIMAAVSLCMPIIIWILGRSKHWIDRPFDVTGAVLKKLIKGGKLNKQGISQAKWLVCLGERDYYNFRYGKIVGLYSGEYCDEYILKTGRLKPSRLLIVPRELRRDFHGSHVLVTCNGFMPVAHFYMPVFTSDMDPKIVNGYYTMMMKQWDWHVQNEKIYESIESGAHAMSEALDITKQNYNIITREDHVPKVPGEDGGEQFAEVNEG